MRYLVTTKPIKTWLVVVSHCDDGQETPMASWLEYMARVQGVVGSNPRKVNGGDRKGI